MQLYSHLQPKDSRVIITLANKGITKADIVRQTGLNNNKAWHNLLKAEVTTIKERLKQPKRALN